MPNRGTRLRLPPRSLLALLAAVLVLGLAWALSVPAFQAPDEPSHFAYTQSLAERFKLPRGGPAFASTDQRRAADAVNADQTAQAPDTKVEWSRAAYRRWQRQAARLPGSARSDGGGPNPASGNPPLYYLIEAGWYQASRGDFFDRLTAARLGSVLWLLVATLATWLLAGEVFARNRLLQIAASSAVGLFPMLTFISASVTPDAMLYALWTVTLWLGARIVTRGLTPLAAAAIAAATAAAILTKLTSYGLLPGVAFVLLLGLWRARRQGLLRLAATAAVAGLLLAVPVGGWLVTASRLDRPAAQPVSASPGGNVNVKRLGGYLWQYYLPKLPFQQPVPELSKLPAYDVWVKTGWAAFGWLEVRFPNPVYPAFAAISVLVLVGALLALLRRRRSLDPWLLAFLVITGTSLLVGLHWTEYQYIVSRHLPFNQGRYLFPLIGLWGLAVAQAVTLLPRRRRPIVVGAVMGGLLVLQIFSLAINAARFYA